MLDLGLIEYLNRTREALNLTTFGIGLFHSAVFGVLVALSGCLRGCNVKGVLRQLGMRQPLRRDEYCQYHCGYGRDYVCMPSAGNIKSGVLE